MWRVTILRPLIGHQVTILPSHWLMSCQSHSNPVAGYGWPMFRCFGKVWEREVCTFRVTNHVWSDGCITIWHTNILSQHNINQPTRLKNASAKVSEKSRAWCHQIQAMTDSPPPSQHSVQQHSKPRPSLLRPCAASLGQANCSGKKMAKWCIPVQTASCLVRVEEWLTANMTNYPQVVKLDTN